jgi:hypothetical protein
MYIVADGSYGSYLFIHLPGQCLLSVFCVLGTILDIVSIRCYAYHKRGPCFLGIYIPVEEDISCIHKLMQ